MPGVRTAVRALMVSTALCTGAARAVAAPAAPPAHKPAAHKASAKPAKHKGKAVRHKPPEHKHAVHTAHERRAPEHAAGRAGPAESPPASPASAPQAQAPPPSPPAVVGPGEGAGARSLPPAPKAEPPPAPAIPPPAAPAAAGDGHKSWQKGRPPRRPSASLPDGAERPQPNDAARAEIAGGATGDASAGADDPELEALNEADRVLFPKPLDGATAGWSWDLPAPVDSGGAEVEASGLPPDGTTDEPPDEERAAVTAEWLKSLTLPNLPVRFDPRVVKYLEFYRDNPRGKAIARVWAKKSGRYAPAIKAALAKAGLPTDLVWLSLIESGHNPSILSPAGAAGLWQFMPEAGRLYGLAVDRWVDERLDPERETEAAVKYLSDLHRRFGNWELAMAAYNMGYGGLSRAIRKFNTNDFWELCRYEAGVPWETTLYVPKILATAIVMNNKRAFGIDDVTPEPAVGFDTVLVAPGVPMGQVAHAAGTDVGTLASLNPAYLAERTPPARPGEHKRQWPVHVPRGTAPETTRRLAHLAGSEPSLAPYVVRYGDTLATIAAAAHSTEARVREINDVGGEETLAPGTVLLVPRAPGVEGADDADKPDVVVVPPRQFAYVDRDRVFYRVLPGDTLGGIARAFGVTRAEITAWNALDRSARLQADMMLSVFVAKGADLSRIRHIAEHDTRVLVAGTREFYDYFEGQKGNRRILVTVHQGDTLAGIGRRYGMSVGWMERVNRFSRHKKLKAGDKVVVYTKQGAVGAPVSDEIKAEPLAPANPPRPDALPPVADSAASTPPASAATTAPHG